jgi:hypothetical protein
MFARAMWRRVAPARNRDIVVPPMTQAERRIVVEQLRGIVGTSGAVWTKMTAVSRLLLGQSAGRSESIVREEPFEPVQLAPGPVPEAPDLAPRESVDRSTLEQARERSRLAQDWLLSLEDSEPADEELVPPAPTAQLPARVRMFAERLAQRERHTLQEMREIAGSLQLIPLDAVSAINDWADQQGVHGEPPAGGVPVIEVDERAGAVWVERVLKEILA